MRKYFEFFLQRKNFIYFNLIFLIILCFNLNNKTLIAAAIGYLFIVSFIFKSLEKSFIFSYLLFNLFMVGKTYEILLIPATLLAYGKDIIGYQGHYQYIIIDASIILGILMISWFIYLILKKRVNVEKDIIVLVSFFIFSFISSLLSINNLVSLFYWFATLSLLPFYYFFKKHLLNDNQMKSDLIKFFTLLVSYETIWAVFQYLKKGSVVPSLEFISNIPWAGLDIDQNWFRPWGSLSHPNDLGNFLLPFAIFFLLSGGYTFITHISRYIKFGLLFSILGILLSLSRSAWISFLFLCLFSAILFEKKYHLRFNPKFKYVILTSLILFLPIIIALGIPRIQKSILTFTEGGSSYSRIELVKESVNLISKYPLFGVGYGMSVLGMFLENPKGEIYYFPATVHNIYLQLTSEIGIIATFFFFIFLGFLILSRKNESANLNYKVKKNIFLASFFSILLNGIFQPLYSQTMLYLIIFATLYYVE